MDRTLALIEQSHRGDKEARKILTEENMGLVYASARRFAGRGCEMEDLVQIGSIGLLKAIDRFDPGFDVRFSTYAVPLIAGEIRRYLRDNTMIRVSRSLKDTARQICAAREALEKEEGREPDVEELAERLGTDREEIVLAIESAAEVESLHAPLYQKDGNAVLLMDRIEDERDEGERDEGERVLNSLLLEQAMEDLEEKEKQLIQLRYFEEQTQMQTAKFLSMTQVQVSRAEKKILRKLCRKIRGKE